MQICRHTITDAHTPLTSWEHKITELYFNPLSHNTEEAACAPPYAIEYI